MDFERSNCFITADSSRGVRSFLVPVLFSSSALRSISSSVRPLSTNAENFPKRSLSFSVVASSCSLLNAAYLLIPM